MKNLIYLTALTLFFTACSSSAPHYVVKGNIEGSDSIMFYIQKRDAGKTITIDSAVSKKGTFVLKAGAVEYPQLIQLVAGNTRKRTSFYLENSEITITGSLDSLFKAKVTGSKTQDEYQTFVDSNKPLSDKYQKIIIEHQAASQAGNFEKVKLLEEQADSIQTEMKNLQKNFVKNNPSSFVSPSILGNLSNDMEAEEIESIINAMDTLVAATPQILSLKEWVAILKNVEIGRKAPEFILDDVDGNPVDLSSEIGSKLLLIDFWAAWCQPCREENPNVVKVYKQFNKKGFDVIGVSLDSQKDAWIKAISDDKLPWTQVSDLLRGNSPVAKLYGIISIPSNFLLDETGTIIAKNLRGEDLYNKVKEVLGGTK